MYCIVSSFSVLFFCKSISFYCITLNFIACIISCNVLHRAELTFALHLGMHVVFCNVLNHTGLYECILHCIVLCYGTECIATNLPSNTTALQHES